VTFLTTHNILDQLTSLARNGTLLYQNGARPGVSGHVSHCAFDSSHVRRATSADTTSLGRSVDTDEDHVCLGDGLCAGSGEEEVWQARRLLDIVEV
jgi:hypothetical protein